MLKQLFACQVSLILAFFIYLCGFFPIKENVIGFAVSNDGPPHLTASDGSTYTSKQLPRYDRLVIVLIDALRQDFVFAHDSPMTFTRSLILSNRTVSFVGRAHTPTVTMPRIKALVGGNVPAFIDVVLNVGSYEFKEDNLVSQMKRANKTLVFYGDDTWLNLFPDHFTRFEGTSSFFVNDYTQVDTNVTRYLPRELEATDWDLMVLHYLGLDHIGHSAGPRSPLVKVKLREMDTIIETIFNKLIMEETDKETLIVVCGDHGMTDGGSHGGATDDETHVPVLLLVPGGPLLEDTYDQIDLVPTVSTLLGLPVPKNSLGVLVPAALSQLGIDQQIHAHHYNAYQLLQVLKINSPNIDREKSFDRYNQAVLSHSHWIKGSHALSEAARNTQGQRVIQHYSAASHMMKDTLTGSLLKYDVYVLWLALTAIAMTFLLLGSIKTTLPSRPRVTLAALFIAGVAILTHIFVCTSQYRSPMVCTTRPPHVMTQVYLLALLCAFLSCITPIVSRSYVIFTSVDMSTRSSMYVMAGLHAVSLWASSFVEEEHQTWYFFVTTIHVALLVCLVVQAYLCGSGHVSRLPDLYPTRANSRQGKGSKTVSIHSNDDKFNEIATVAMDSTNSVIKRADKGLENDYHGYDSRSAYNDKSDVDAHVSQDTKGREDCRDRFGVWSSLHRSGSVVRKVIGVVAVLGLCRLMRSWNQTGDKWSASPDMKQWLTRQDNRNILTCLVIISLLSISAMRHRRHASVITTLSLLIGLIACYCFRAANGTFTLYSFYISPNKGVSEARLVLLCSSVICVETVYKMLTATDDPRRHYITSVERLLSTWLLFACLVVRAHNIPLVAALTLVEVLTSECSSRVMSRHTPSLALYYLCLAQASFFYQGNSNKLSTLDMSAAFIGLDSYRPAAAAIMLALATYAIFLIWMISLLKAIIVKSSQTSTGMPSFYKNLSKELLDTAWTLTMSRTLPLFAYAVCTTVQRYHLFVWTVFSPKLLYEAMLLLIVTLFSWSLLIVSRICANKIKTISI